MPGRPPAGSDRDGLYLAANFNYLYGLRYDAVDLGLRLDTDSTGLVTQSPATAPLVLDRTTSSRGRGFDVDFASVAVIDR